MARSAPSNAARSATSRSATASASKAAASTASDAAPAGASIRVGIGGWTYEPWRDNFYPPKLAHARELAYASRHVTAIEINATFYRLMSAKSFASWRDETPDGFVFTLKGSRYVTNRKVLGEAGESIERFMASGLNELGDKLGAVAWQFATHKAFDPDDFAAFLRLLPAEVGGRRLRHAVEVRHASFMCEAFLDLARAHGVAVVFADSDDYPSFADSTADFVYTRLMRTEGDQPSGYRPERLDLVSEAVRAWSTGRPVGSLPRVVANQEPGQKDVFAFFISGAKERAPAAAMALLERLGLSPDDDSTAEKKKPREGR